MMAPQQFSKDRGLQSRMVLTMFLLAMVYGLFIYFLLSLGTGVVLMLVVVVVLVGVQIAFSDRMVLTMMRAKVVSPEDQPGLHKIVDRLSLAAGIPKPKVAVADMKIPNAFATGRSQKTAAVAVTTGLLELLNEREVEGVLAHEISHIRTRDVVVMTYASFFSVVAGTLMTMFFWMGLFGGFGGGMGRSRSGGGGSAIMVAYIATIAVWLISQILVAALSRYREYSADRGAAQLTHRPQDLASALQRMSERFTKLPKQDLRRTESLNAFFIMPAIGGSLASLFSTHPSVSRRVQRLQEIEQELAYL